MNEKVMLVLAISMGAMLCVAGSVLAVSSPSPSMSSAQTGHWEMLARGGGGHHGGEGRSESHHRGFRSDDFSFDDSGHHRGGDHFEDDFQRSGDDDFSRAGDDSFHPDDSRGFDDSGHHGGGHR